MYWDNVAVVYGLQNCISNSVLLFSIISLSNRKLEYNLRSFMTSVFTDRKSFITNLCMTAKIERCNVTYCFGSSWSLLWSPYVIGQTIIFSSCFFLLLRSFFPRLISAVGDWMFTIDFGTWCGLSANLECRSEMRCTRLAANTGRKKSSSTHHRTTLSGHIFATKACIDNRKKLVKQQYLLYMSW